MRELKFRAWANGYEKWCHSIEYMGDGFWLGYVDDGIGELSTTDIIVEQYTGLKDKNDKEICEGDIVRWSFKGMNNRLIHTADAVEWKSYAEEEWPYSTISGFTLPDSEDGYEVIGNIHENPELLGEEKE